MDILPIRAFRDNYIWSLQRGTAAAVVDPGDPAPVIAHLREHGLALAAILVTHHHPDHVGGLAGLVEAAGARIPVFGPAGEDIPEVTQALREGDRITVPGIDLELSVLDVPGHTRGHIAYYGPKLLLCGDTLFACGCGRLFEGSAAQMWASLSKLAALPPDTRVFCAHEYTQANIRFALAVEPGNRALQERAGRVDALRARGEPSLPCLISEELATNPFLRPDAPEVAESARRRAGRPLAGPVEVFAAIREWKNNA